MITWLAWRDKLEQSYWFVPTLMSIGSILLAYLALHFEKAFGETFGSLSWVFTRDPQGARELLSTIGGSLITVTGVVFSVTLVALTNASSQYGTRILNTFARDLGNKFVLGAFVATFLYCILVMRTITEQDGGYVPHFAVFIAVILSMLAFGVLIYFIHHLIELLQSENVVHSLLRDLKATVDRMYPSRFGTSAQPIDPAAADTSQTISIPVAAPAGGYVQAIDSDRIMRAACAHRSVVVLVARPGDFVVPGMTIARCAANSDRCSELTHQIETSFTIGKKRTYVQDVGFGFEQLQLVAIRALSPAMNNQILGMACTDRIVEALVYLGSRTVPSAFRKDESGQVRVIAEPITHCDAVHLALDLVIEVAQTSPSVTVHIFQTLDRVASQIQPEDMRKGVLKFAESLHRGSLTGNTAHETAARTSDAYEHLRRAYGVVATCD